MKIDLKYLQNLKITFLHVSPIPLGTFGPQRHLVYNLFRIKRQRNHDEVPKKHCSSRHLSSSAGCPSLLARPGSGSFGNFLSSQSLKETCLNSLLNVWVGSFEHYQVTSVPLHLPQLKPSKKKYRNLCRLANELQRKYCMFRARRKNEKKLKFADLPVRFCFELLNH